MISTSGVTGAAIEALIGSIGITAASLLCALASFSATVL
jgi:hypothetical protein